MRLAAVLLAGAVLGGCSVTANVIGRLGNSPDEFTGTAVGEMDRTGTIAVSDGKGLTCQGQFRYTGSSIGVGILYCSDGQSAHFRFTALSMTSGYGMGTSDRGIPIRFTFGLDRTEAMAYLGPPPSQGAAPAEPASGSFGTGFFVSDAGHVLTNHHVAGRCKDVTIRNLRGEITKATLLGGDQANDLALLATGAAPPSVAMFRDGRPLRLGEGVVVFGFPLAGNHSEAGTLTTGILSAMVGFANNSAEVQITAPIQGGNSGGPLLDSSGNVIGVIVATLNARKMMQETGSLPQNVNFAVKGTVARGFLESYGVLPKAKPTGKDLAPADIAEMAKPFTVFITCKR
ncbi:MAG: trypsin-like peptidase domain-containing protein [Alphaproteobacteria bacterium]|nr:trypsin-like peptidase domain-containing protein [Alphaproteobacteria bacterium]